MSFIYTSPRQPLNALKYSFGSPQGRFSFPPENNRNKVFVCDDALHPSQHISVMLETFVCLPWLDQ